MISAIFLKIMRFITIFLLSVLVISCETTSPITSPEIIPEPEQKIIYEPKEEVQVIEDKEQRKIRDFYNIKSFEGKKISSLQEQYGDFNFSKQVDSTMFVIFSPLGKFVPSDI